MTRRFFRLRTLTDPSTLRLAPSGPRPNALPLHDVRDPKTIKGRRRIDTHRRPFRPSSRQALSRSTKLMNRIGRIGARPISLTPVETSALSLGGARRDRTDDLMLAKHALSQLSYGPVPRPAGAQRPIVVGLGGLEPPTSRLSSARSNQLSYKPGRKKKSTPAHGPSKPTEARGFHILRLRKRDEGGAIPQNAA